MNYYSDTGYLTINGVSMHTPAWALVDVLPLWPLPQKFRGEDVIIGELEGQRAYEKIIEEAHHSLPMGIVGDYDRTGAPTGNRWTGLQANIAYLEANVVTTSSAVTHAATLTMPNGAVLAADVQVESIQLGQHFSDLVFATLELTIPAGVFA